MRSTLVAAPALLFALATACSEEHAGRDRPVPEGYYPKELFQGEWYFREAVIDVPFETAFVQEGEASPLERVRWDVQEKVILAYRAYEHVVGADGAEPEGEVVAAWAVTGHFGAPGAPWWERAYFRVDWSRNLAGDASRISSALGPVSGLSEANHFVEAPAADDPDRPEITADYIGVVGKYLVQSDPAACARFVELVFGDGDTSPCLPTSVRVRSSFVKVDPARPEYEPLEHPDRFPLAADLNGDGTIAGDEVLGPVLRLPPSDHQGRQLVYECTPAVIAAVSEDPYLRGIGVDASRCEVATEGAFERFGYSRTERPVYDRQQSIMSLGRLQLANRWNLWERSFDEHGGPIPIEEREPRTIVYHTSAGFPDELLPRVVEIGAEIDRALVETVAAVRGVPKLDPGLVLFRIAPNDCSRDGVRNFVGKHHQERAVERLIGGLDRLGPTNLTRVCAGLERFGFEWQKEGDLRHSFLDWIDRPQQRGPLGFATVSADPETGEIVSASTHVYGAALDRQAALATSVVELLRGHVTVDEVASGEDVRVLIARARDLEAAESLRAREGSGALARELTEPGGATESSGAIAGRGLDALGRDPAVESSLIDTESLLLVGWRPGDAVTPELVRKAGPRGELAREQDRRNLLRRLGTGSCMLLETSTEADAAAIALDYGPGERTRDEVFQDLRARLFAGVALHELLHTLGLRHNFSGSNDALNYFDRFWDIAWLPDRADEARYSPESVDRARLEACVSEAERENAPPPTTLDCLHGISYQQASVLDYGPWLAAEAPVLGKYDRAAIRFGYGGLVDTFTEPISSRLAEQLFWGDYRSIPDYLGNSPSAVPRQAVRLDLRLREEILQIRERSTAASLPVMDPSSGSCLRNCRLPSQDTVEVPYQFCSDEYADRVGMRCRRWDVGGNADEVVENALRRQRVLYPFLAFRRGRVGWDPRSYTDDVSDRTLATISASVSDYEFFAGRGDAGLSGDLARAALRGMNALAGMLATPQNGWYCAFDGVFQRCSGDQSGEKIFLPLGIGKPYWTDFASDYHATIEGSGERSLRRAILYELAGPLQQFRFEDPRDPGAVPPSTYYRILPESVIQLFRRSMLGGPEAGDVYRTADGLVYWPRFFFDGSIVPGPGEHVGALEPLSRYDRTLPLLAAALGLSSLSRADDSTLDFSAYLNLALKGSPEELSWIVDREDPSRYAQVTDPETGRTFVATGTSDGLSITHELVTRVSTFLAAYYIPALEAFEADPTDYSRELTLARRKYELREQLEYLDQLLALRRLYP